MEYLRNRNRYTPIFLVTLLLLATFAALVPMAFAEDSSGTANVDNSSPSITAIDLTNAVPTTVEGTQLLVWTEYRVPVTVEDTNKLTDLDTIEFIIWDPTTSSEGGGDTEADHYTFLYTESGDAWTEEGPDAATDTHLVDANCVEPGNKEVNSGQFILAFRTSKIAQHTETALWDIKVIVTDDGALSANDATLTFGLAYYEELTIDDASHGWSSLSAGGNDIIMDTPDADLDITITSNDDFDVQAKGNGALTKGGDTIPLANVIIHKDTVGSAISLTTSYVDITGITEQTAGASQARSFVLWIDVPDPCPGGAYTYTLSVQVVEDV